MRLVDEAEVGLEPLEHVGLRAEQGAVGGEQAVERRPPPGELELGGDLLLGHVPAREVGDQVVELQLPQAADQAAALLQVLQHVGVCGEAGQQLAELVQRQVRELLLARGVAERGVERRQVLRDLLPGDVHVADAGRHLGRDARGDEALPQDALLLDAR